MLPKVKLPKNPIYLDYAATTPVDPQVLKAMAPFFNEKYGNPSSLYKQGRESKIAIDQARLKIASLIGVRPGEIIFTAGGTESVNLAILGSVNILNGIKDKHIITSAIEHHSVLRCCEFLKQAGADVTFVPVNSQGVINLDELQKSITPKTVLISVMYANNEIGSIQPIVQIGKMLKKINLQRIQNKLPKIYFHTDACQATGYLDINPDHLGVDLMSVNASKIYGPKQIGFLYVRSGVKLNPIIYGGGQEKDLRSGTENVPGIVGLAKALEISVKEQSFEIKRIGHLQKYLWDKLSKKIARIKLNGTYLNKNRLPNNLNIKINGIEGESLMIYLDSYNVAVSTGSACATSSTDPSHVLLALGLTNNDAQSSIRISLGKYTIKKDLDYLIKIFPGIVNSLRKVKK